MRDTIKMDCHPEQSEGRQGRESFSFDEQHAMVLFRSTAASDHGWIVAGRPRGAPGLLSGGHGRCAVCIAEITGAVCQVLGRAFGRMGRISRLHRRSAVLCPGFPLAETPN